MRQKRYRNILILVVSTLLLILFFSLMLANINRMQGDARVVNYAGIIRGATQRLIKSEMYGFQNDAEILRLDDILLGLQTGKGSQNLIVLRETDYQNKLNKLVEEWQPLKKLIYDFRKNSSLEEEIYFMSERYFTIADETVSAAEMYSEHTAQQLRLMEILSICCIFVIMSILLLQIITEINHNRKLKSIAYLDRNTGLPNRLSCEEQIKNDSLLKSGTVCCFMFDLNNLKIVNDTLGHNAGDSLIAGFAGALSRSAPENMFVGRLGGDEFIGIMPIADLQSVETFENKLLQEVKKVNAEGNSYLLNISFAYGYALSSDYDNCTIKMLLDIADRKMYENKLIEKQELIQIWNK